MTSNMLPPVEVPVRVRRGLIALTVTGIVAAAAGAVAAPQQMWANWLLVSYLILTLALGGLCFVAIHYASGASWGVAIRRVPEGLAALIPVGAIALGAVFIARPQLYPWSSGEYGHGVESALAFKRLWLDWPLFLARAASYTVVWTLFGWALRRQSRLQDMGDADWRTMTSRRLSAAFLVVFAVTFSLAGFDWVMSLEPAWYSSIFGVYQFAGLFLATIAAITLLALWLARTGPLAEWLHEDHLHDLGKLLFAFSTFWAYIWFSQFMLIWYANIPEETSYFTSRMQGGWFILFVLNVVLNWGVPFVVLLRRDTKRNRTVLASIAVIILLGRWLDLYLMILPPILGESPNIGPWEIGLVAGGVGVFGLALARALRAVSIVPVGDPHLPESLHPVHGHVSN